MTCRNAVRRVGGERGTALIEMALTLPLMLLVSVAIFEFGRAYQTWEILTNAAREGARVAVLPNSVPTDVQARVRTYLTNGGLDAAPSAGIAVATVPISYGASTANASQVSISYPFTFMVLQPVANLVKGGSSLGAPITMTASAVMRNESQ